MGGFIDGGLQRSSCWIAPPGQRSLRLLREIQFLRADGLNLLKGELNAPFFGIFTYHRSDDSHSGRSNNQSVDRIGDGESWDRIGGDLAPRVNKFPSCYADEPA
ncbi:MAG: hypothetical protein ACLTSX_02665 [Collinsella sp.]